MAQNYITNRIKNIMLQQNFTICKLLKLSNIPLKTLDAMFKKYEYPSIDNYKSL